MEIKTTPWEKRNLGVESSVEFHVAQDDAWQDICDAVDGCREVYQVMRIPGGNTDVLLNAGASGFRMIEMNIQLSRKLDQVTLPRMFRRFEGALSCAVASEAETEFLLDAIRTRNIFSTDKVARDPAFGTEHAGRRYAYWTRDVLDRGAEMLCMRYKDQIIGFDVCVDRSNQVAEAFLGGILPEYASSGLGFSLIYLITKYAMEKGFRKIVTGVSSNNLPILKLHEMLGYSVDGMNYCLIRHLPEGNG